MRWHLIWIWDRKWILKVGIQLHGATKKSKLLLQPCKKVLSKWQLGSVGVGVVFSVTNPPCNSSPPLPSKSTQFRFGWRLFGCFNVNSKDTFLIMVEYKNCFVKKKILNLKGNDPLKKGLKRDLNGSLKVSHLCIFFKFPVFRFFVLKLFLWLVVQAVLKKWYTFLYFKVGVGVI